MRKNEDLAYLAGYVDADGYIGLQHVRGRNRYSPVVCITASRKDILEQLQAIAAIGGYIWTGKNNKTALRDHSKLFYSERKACKICTMVVPYLRLKGAQAALLSQIGLFRSNHANGRGFNIQSYYGPRYEEMKRLNEGNKSKRFR